MESDEFDSIMEQYTRLMDAGAEDYLISAAKDMTETLLLDSAEMVPVIAMNPLYGKPFVATIAIIGLKVIDGDEYQVGLSWFPHANVPKELVRMWKEEKTDDKDVVAYLLSKRWAIIALDEDTVDADVMGWSSILKEVHVGERNTNFEEAVAGDSEEAQDLMDDFLNSTTANYQDLINAIMTAVQEAEYMIPVEVDIDEDAEEFDASFISNWE